MSATSQRPKANLYLLSKMYKAQIDIWAIIYRHRAKKLSTYNALIKSNPDITTLTGDTFTIDPTKLVFGQNNISPASSMSVTADYSLGYANLSYTSAGPNGLASDTDGFYILAYNRTTKLFYSVGMVDLRFAGSTTFSISEFVTASGQIIDVYGMMCKDDGISYNPSSLSIHASCTVVP